MAFTTPIIKRPSSASSHRRPLSGRDLESEIASHVHHPSPNPSLPLPPVEPSRQLSSSPNPTSGKGAYSELEQGSSSPKLGLALDISSATRSARSIQTPPPTSTTSSKRKAQRAQVAKFQQQLAANTRRMSVPGLGVTADVEESNTKAENSPLQFSSFQFSPDTFGFPISGPATAPVYPQHKLFWELGQNDGMDIDLTVNLDDPFSTDNRSALDPFVSTSHQSFTAQASDPSFFLNFPAGVPKGLSDVSTSTHEHAHPTSTTESVKEKPIPRKFLASGVNPSLLFSSGSHSSEPVNGPSAATQPLDEDALQPYAYQIQEAKREKAFSGAARSNKKRKPVSDSPAVKAVGKALREDGLDRPSSRRSVTDSSVTRSSGDLPTQNDSKRIKRPIGRLPSTNLRRSNCNHGRESQYQPRRTAVSLTIDASGRARTETRTIIEDHISYLGDSRAPGGSDVDSDSSSDDSNLAAITSQAPSFEFVSFKRRQPKLGRFNTRSKSHSKKSSSTSVYTSSSFADGLSRPSSGKSNTNHNVNPNFVIDQNASQCHVHSAATMPSVKFSSETSDEAEVSEAETVLGPEDPTGTAQFELKKMLKDRARDRTIRLVTSRNATDRSEPKPCVHSPIEKTTRSYGIATIPTPNPRSAHPGVSDLSPNLVTDRGPISLDDGNLENVRCVCQGSIGNGQVIVWYVLLDSLQVIW